MRSCILGQSKKFGADTKNVKLLGSIEKQGVNRSEERELSVQVQRCLQMPAQVDKVLEKVHRLHVFIPQCIEC